MRHASQLPRLILSAALTTSAAYANTLSAPDTVHADQSGDFVYRFTCTITPDSTLIAGVGWNIGTNVTGAMHGDCFCFPNCWIGPGEGLFFDVTGSLVEPTIPGTVDNWVAFCLVDPDLHSVTTVMPYQPTLTLPVTWGLIKTRYR
jgi:hypothetical protein